MEPVLAITPQNNEAFLREVDEELRRDQAVQFWERYGRWAIGVVLVALAAFGGYLFWQNQQQKNAARLSEEYTSVTEKLVGGDTKAAEKALADLAKSGSAGYRPLSKFLQADLLLQKQDLKGAAAKFAEVATDSAVAKPLRDLALIRQTSAEYDTLKPDVVIARLKPLAVKGEPWFGSAGEMVAIAYLQQGKNDLAGALYSQMARDKDVPQSLRDRSTQIAGALGIDAVDQTEEKKSQ